MNFFFVAVAAGKLLTPLWGISNLSGAESGVGYGADGGG